MKQQKKVIKLYKSGKLWVTAAIVVGGMIVSTSVSAATGGESTNVNSSTQQNITAQKLSVADQTKVADESTKLSANDQVKTNSATTTLTDENQTVNEHVATTVNSSRSNTTENEDKSVDASEIDKAVNDAQDASVEVTETPAKSTNIQGVEDSDKNEQVIGQQDTDKADYQNQIDRLNAAKEQQKAQDQKYADDKASYEAALAAGKQTNSDGKTQIATSSAPQALALDKSKPADETAPTGTMTPTKVYSGDSDAGKNSNLKDSSKIWEYSGNQLLNKNTVINKTWVKSGTIIVRDNTGALVERAVDLNESFHDFQLQNGNWSETNDYHDQGIPKVTISSNAIDNVEMWNLNWQTTFWFTYSDNNEIVPISKMTGTAGDPKVYFLSASLSASNYTGPDNPGQWDSWQTNEKEYVQTNDAKTVVVAANSTISLGNISNSQNVVNNAPNNQAYVNNSNSYHDANDDDPDVYALKEGVSFTDFTTDKPTLFLGSVPTNPTARWWHSNHNMNSDELAFVQSPVKAQNVSADYHLNTISYKQASVKQVNEIIKYVYQSDNTPVKNNNGQSLDYNAENIQFVTTTDNNGKDIVWTAKGSVDVPTIDGETGNISTSGWSKVENNQFKEVINPVVQGYHVVSTTDTDNDLSKTTEKIVNKDSQNIDITVFYAKDQGNLVVNYVDEAGNVLVVADSSTKDSGEDYTTTPKLIDGYDLVPTKTTGDVAGQYPADGQTKEVTYVYGQQGQHTTNYVDESGAVLSPADSSSKDSGENYTTEPKSIDGYDLIPTKTTGDVAGQYPADGQTAEVTYVYGQQGQHTTNYVDENGKELIPTDTTKGPKDTDYTTTPTEIPGYHLVPEKTTGDETGKYDTGKTTDTTYVYAKDQGNLIVNYVDEAGNALTTADKTTADTNQDYTTAPKSIDGYDLIPTKTTGDVAGQYPADGQTAEVTYVYGQQGQHTTNYVDEDGKILVPTDTTKGPKDTDYKTTPAEVPGYHLVPEKTTGDETGKYDTGKTTDTTYVYAKDQGNLVVNYVDEDGNALTVADKSTADTNQDYTTTPKSIDGYDLIPSKTTGDVAGQYPNDGETKEVTYVYGKQGQHTTNYVDEDGKTLVPTDTTKGPKDTEYTTTPAEVPGYHLVPEKTTGDETGKYDTGKTTDTTYVYAKDQGNLVVNYVDESGQVIAGKDSSTKDSGEDYTTGPKSIDGYDLIPTKTTGDVASQYPADGETKEVTYVYGQQGQHTTNYVDEAGKTLVPTEQTQGPKDTTFNTTPAEVPGYHLVPEKTTGDETGKYDTGKNTDTTYVYAKDQGSLVVNYVDEAGNVFVVADSSTKDSGEDYTTAPKAIDGYDLVSTKTTGDVAGQYPENGETKEVTYVYGQQGQHTTNYVDEEGKTLISTDTTNGPKDTEYKTTPTEIPGYHLVPEKTTGDETGKYDTGKTTDTTYVYAKDQGNLVVNYVDESGQVIAGKESSTKNSGEDYTTTPKSIDGYDLIPTKTTGDVTGQYPNDGETKEVTYVYGKQGQHTTNYVDEDGKTLVPTEQTQGPKDTDYTTTPVEVPGYHLVPEKTTGDETGKYDTGKTTDTTYVYAKDQGSLVVNYVDENGTVLAPADSSTQNSGEAYTTVPKAIVGYDLVPNKTTGEVTGNYPNDGETKEVTYVYSKQGQHTTNYVDEDGKTLVPTDTTNGPKDTEYKTMPAEVPGYHLVPAKTTGDETGKYDTGKTTDTTYVYAKDQGSLVVNYVDENGSVLSPADSSSKDSGEAYATTPKAIDGYDLIPTKTTGDINGQYPDDSQTAEVTYVYGKQGQHTTNYVDEDGKTLVPTEQTQGPKDTTFNTTPAEVPGYHLVPEKTTGDETGTYDTGKTTDTTYVYAKDQGSLVVNYVDENGSVLSPADSSSKDSGEAYTTTPKAIDGYDLIPTKTTGDINGKYPVDSQTAEVTYVYGKQGQHTTNYVDEAGKTLVPTEQTQGPKDTTFNTTPAEVPGYHLVPEKTTGDETGKYDTGKNTDTTYVYAKDQGSLVVNYVDEAGNVFVVADSSTKDSGEDYTTAPKAIDGYDLVSTKTTGDVAGQYPENGETKEVTYVYGQQGQHTTNYVDEEGKTLIPTDTTNGPKDTEYKTTPTEIPGYHLVPEKTTGDETGKYDTGKTTDTTYVYAKDQGSLVVNYVDENGTVLAPADSSTKASGEAYTTTPKTVAGYDLVPSKTTGNVTGQYPNDGETKAVTYVYGKQGQHTTNYVDEDGKTLVPTEQNQGPKDTDYTTTPAEVPGYHLVPEKTTGDETGKYDTGKTTDTTYVYAKDQGNLVVNYVDEDGTVLAPADSSTKDSGEAYTTTPKNVDGYDLVPSKTTGEVTGDYPNDGETKTVTYVYGKQGQHTTNYVDENGKTLVPTDTTKGPKDTEYTTAPAEIPGYHLVPEKTTGDETGKYDTGKTTDTTYVYAKDQGNLVVNYVDESGQVIAGKDSSTKASGEHYTTAPKAIDGYDLVPSKTTGDVAGQYPNDGETIEVTYVYGKQGQHTTNYVDEAGNELVPSEQKQGPKDTTFNTTPAEVPGYHLVPEKTTGGETGKYDTGKTTDTTYVYAKDQGNLVVNYIDESGSVLSPADSSSKDSGADYTTGPKSIDGYDLIPSKTTGDVTGKYPKDGETKEVTYVYGKQGQHTTNYVDEDGQPLVPTDTTKGPKDTNYTTTPAEVPGYHLVPAKTTGDETGTYDTGKNTDTTYVYAKNQGPKSEEKLVEKNPKQKYDDHKFVLKSSQVAQDKAQSKQSNNLIKKETSEKSVKQLPKTGEEIQSHNKISMILGLTLSTIGLTMLGKKRKNK
ncbi:MucBP domain-containing protein [Leuconostoc sp. MS02]|uniref:MucBP domain-containing protein n=1 Tax=Leuconostoc aquikimchii TaxID=3236804 RepID=A0ABV3S3P3_9LACO